MTLTQLRNATTKMDLDKIKYTKGKKKYIYSVLTTIARQENDNSFEHLYNTKHKLTADTIKMLKENIVLCSIEWHSFFNSYLNL